MGHGADVADQVAANKNGNKYVAKDNADRLYSLIEQGYSRDQAIQMINSGSDVTSNAIKQGFTSEEAKQKQQLADQQAKAQKDQQEALKKQGVDTSTFLDDGYGGASTASQSVRRRGSTDQQRIGQDTRVREMGNTGGQGMGSVGGDMSAAMSAPEVAAPTTQNSMWKASRAPTDLASVQSRVVQSLSGMKR